MSTKNKVQLVILGLLLVLSVSSLIFFMHSNTTQCYTTSSIATKVASIEQVAGNDSYGFLNKSHLSFSNSTISAAENLFKFSLFDGANSMKNSVLLIYHPFKFYFFSFTPFVTMCFKYTL